MAGEGSHVAEPEGISVINEEQSNDFGSDEVQDTYTQNLALFYLGLQVKYLVPAATITEIANEMKTLQDIQQEYTMDVLSQQLEQYGVPTETLTCLGKSAYEQGPMHEVLHANGPLTTHHQGLQYYKTHCNYVQPVEVTLGYDDRGQKRHYHYIPVLESLRAILKQGSAAQHSFNLLLVKDGTLHDFTDGHAIRSNVTFALDPDSLKVMLFQDAFEVANPLDLPSKNTKY